ncbi:MAG: hypothetical protein MUC99_12560 [Anaerolineae bacterium]|nr:hypothetical protein [Anaerolineae bacterium]
MVTWDEAAQAVVGGFAQVFEVEWVSAAGLTPAEAERAQQLVDEKHRSPVYLSAR